VDTFEVPDGCVIVAQVVVVRQPPLAKSGSTRPRTPSNPGVLNVEEMEMGPKLCRSKVDDRFQDLGQSLEEAMVVRRIRLSAMVMTWNKLPSKMLASKAMKELKRGSLLMVMSRQLTILCLGDLWWN